MSSVPVAVKLAVAVLVVASVAWGFAGRPPVRPHPGFARVFLGAAGVAYFAGALELALGAALVAGLVALAGVETACVAAWLARAPERGRTSRDGPSPVGWDWDEFDRVRAAWEQERRPRATG